MNGYPGEGSPACIDHLLGKQIGAIRRKHHAVEGKPVGNPQERADVAGILHAIESQSQTAGQPRIGQGLVVDSPYGQDG